MEKTLDRVHRIWEKVREDRKHAGISLERAKLATESWSASEGYPTPIRRGMMTEYILKNIPLYLDEGQLICGNYTSHSMWGEWYPEYESRFLLNASEDEPALQKMSKDTADQKEILRIAGFWNKLSIEDQFLNYFTDEELKQLSVLGEDGSNAFALNTTRSRQGGYYSPGIFKVVKKGYKGIIEDIDAELKSLVIRDHDDLKKSQNLQGWKHALQGGIAYGHRCADHCRTLAEKEQDEKRRQELLEMARVCDWVPENPARTLHEALQATYFAQAFIYIESRGDGVSPGRVDQYCYECYKNDVDGGRLTREQAMELINCFRIKFNGFRQLSSKAFMNNTSGEAQFHNITLGGVDAQGNSAVNELSYLFLDAALELPMPHPTLSVRCFKGMPRDFFDKALQVVATGVGYPAFFSDSANIGTMVKYGIAPEDANDYAIGGCVEAMPAGRTAPGYPVFLNNPKALELALYDGFDYYAGQQQVGPHTGRFEDFDTFDDFYAAVKKQTVFISEWASRYCKVQRAIRDDMCAVGFTDALIDDCVARGKTSAGGGAKYNIQYHNATGIIDLTDSLAAIKKCVFEDKTVSKETLIKALKANFEGYEDVRETLMAAPKYGNDDDYADSIAADFYSWWADSINENPNYDAGFGTHYVPAAYSVSRHGPSGKYTGALPTGRLAGEFLADGSMSPRQGVDLNGPTAVLNSAGKIDQSKYTNTLLNMKFQGGTLKNNGDRAKLAALIETYFAMGGKHIQFNIVDKETLEDAQAAPERHGDLIVRVAGYSAFFIELTENIQAELISRTEENL